MKRIFFSLIFVLVILTSVSLVCASDGDNVTNDFQGVNVIIPPTELDGLDADNHFEGNYSTQEEIDECLPINITDDLNGNIDFNDNITIEREYEPRIEPMFEVVDYNISGGVINLTLLVTNPDTGKGLADLPIILDYNCGKSLKPYSDKASFAELHKHAVMETLKIDNGKSSLVESCKPALIETLELATGSTDENGYVTFSVPFTGQLYFRFSSPSGKFIFIVPPSVFNIREVHRMPNISEES